jgi:hypothetical protein
MSRKICTEKKWIIEVKRKGLSTHITYNKRLQAIHTNNKSRYTKKEEASKEKDY